MCLALADPGGLAQTHAGERRSAPYELPDRERPLPAEAVWENLEFCPSPDGGW